MISDRWRRVLYKINQKFSWNMETKYHRFQPLYATIRGRPVRVAIRLVYGALVQMPSIFAITHSRKVISQDGESLQNPVISLNLLKCISADQGRRNGPVSVILPPGYSSTWCVTRCGDNIQWKWQCYQHSLQLKARLHWSILHAIRRGINSLWLTSLTRCSPTIKAGGRAILVVSHWCFYTPPSKIDQCIYFLLISINYPCVHW